MVLLQMLHIEPKFSIATYIEDKSDTVLDMYSCAQFEPCMELRA